MLPIEGVRTATHPACAEYPLEEEEKKEGMGVICFDSLHWHKPPLLPPPPLLGIDERSESNYPRLEVCKRFATYII